MVRKPRKRRDADLFSGEQQLLSRAQNLTSTEIFFDPVLLHSIELQRFCRSEHKSRYPPIPVENTSKRPPDPNRIEVQHLPSLNEGQCAEVTRSAIFLLAQHVGYDELSVDVVNTLFAVMDSHLTDMMDFYAVCQQRRRDKLSCAFKTNVAQQVLSMFNIRYPGVLRDYYNASVRQARNYMRKKAEDMVAGGSRPKEHEKAEDDDLIEMEGWEDSAGEDSSDFDLE